MAAADPIALPDVTPLDDRADPVHLGHHRLPEGRRCCTTAGSVNNAQLFMHGGPVGPDDVVVTPMPLFHTAGCGMGVLGALSARATLVCLTQFDPALQLELIESERASITLGVPTMLIALLGHPDFAGRDLSSLRVVGSGGAPVPAEVAERIERPLRCAGSRSSTASPSARRSLP